MVSQSSAFIEPCDHNDLAIILVDKNGQIQWVNDVFESMTGYSSMEVLHQTPLLLRPHQSKQNSFLKLWSFIRKHDFWQGILNYHHKERGILDAFTTINRIQTIDSVQFIIHLHSQSLSIAKRCQLLNHIPLAFWASGKNGVRNFFNQSFLDFFEMPFADAISGFWEKKIHADDLPKYQSDFALALKLHQPLKSIFRIQINGDWRSICEETKPCFNTKGTLVGFIGTCIDISENLSIQSALLQTKDHLIQKNQIKSQLFESLYREANPALDQIQNLTQTLCTGKIELNSIFSSLKQIQSLSSHIQVLFNELNELTHSDSQPLKIQNDAVAVGTLCRQLFDEFYFRTIQKGLRFYLDIPVSENGPWLRGDRILWKKIIWLALQYSIDKMESGFLHLGMDLVEKKQGHLVTFTIEGQINSLETPVSNSYFPSDSWPNQLELARTLCNEIDGTLTFDCNQQNWHRFLIKIPSRGKFKDRLNHIRFGGEHPLVLIAEDDPTLTLVLEELLNLHGYSVLEATDGKDAVRLALGENQIEIILMDLDMPQMNGYEAARLIKQVRPEMPIIAVTGLDTTEHLHQLFDSGFDDFLSKPILDSKLFSAIERALLSKRESNP